MSNLLPPVTVEQFKSFFDRGFNFGKGKDTVRDSDIVNAMDMAMVVYDPSLWGTDPRKVAFKFLTAHNLALMVQAAGGLSVVQGRKGGVKSRSTGVIQAKTVGGVTVNYAVVQKAVDDPMLNQYVQTQYGMVYLTLLAPYLTGAVSGASGPNDTGGNFFPPQIGESQ